MYAAGVPHRTRGKLLGTAACVSAHMVGEATPAVGANAAFAGVVLLSFVTPFEATRPLLRLPSQSISTLEAALLLSFGVWALALIASTSRPGLATVGAQVRAGGSLQYPTIASMYLEIVFAFGLGLLLIELDAERRGRTAAVFAALVLIAEAIALTFTRTGLITMAASLAL